jgi:hypothetical protein
MWWLFGILGALVYVGLFFTFGLYTLRNRHVILFLLGFALPFMWIIGGLWSKADARMEAA